LRKLSIFLLAAVFLMTSMMPGYAAAAEMTLLQKTAAVENIFYGAEQTGPLTERTGKLERDVFGMETQDALLAKVDNLYAFAKENRQNHPSFLLKVSAVEWTVNHQVNGQQPARERMATIEQALVGNSGNGSYSKRIQDLVKLAYAEGTVEPVATTVSKDTLVKIAFLSSLSSKTSRPGDPVVYEAAEDVYMGGILVLAKGSKGIGKVNRVERAQNFGRDAKLEIDFQSLELMDGKAAPVFLGEKAKEETKSLAKAAGATVAGMVILGPVGVIGGAFIKGEAVEIKPGSVMYLQVKEDVDTYGIKTKLQ